MLDICFVFCDIQREILDYFENNHESGGDRDRKYM